MKLVSIIIPYYKKKSYIEQTLKSILKQKYKYFEILIIYDDNSKKDLPFLKTLKKRINALNYLSIKRILAQACLEIRVLNYPKVNI